MAEYNRLQTGVTYQQAVQIIGESGQEISRSDLAGIVTVMYGWSNPNGSNMNAMFQNGGLVNKAQFGPKIHRLVSRNLKLVNLTSER